jgi:hypothetical protein
MYLARDIMDLAASLLNDSAKTLYSYPVQLPYLRIAQQELQQSLDLHECPVNLISEYETTIPIGTEHPSLPTDFFLPISLQERKLGETLESSYVPMNEVANVRDLRLDPATTLIYWDYRHNCINFVKGGATQDRQVRIYYWRQLDVANAGINEYASLPFRGAEPVLEFRTAALCSLYIGGNKDRYTLLNLDWGAAEDKLLSLITKNNQGKRVRRKPFRVGRGYGHYRVTVP